MLDNKGGSPPMHDSKGGMGTETPPRGLDRNPTPPKLPKPPDLPAVGTRLLYIESEDCEAFFATVTEHRLSTKAAPGQWVVKYCSDGYDGEDDNGWDYGLPLAAAVAAAAKQQRALFGRLGSLQVPNGAQSEPWPESARPSRTKGGAVLTQARPLGQQTGEAPVG